MRFMYPPPLSETFRSAPTTFIQRLCKYVVFPILGHPGSWSLDFLTYSRPIHQPNDRLLHYHRNGPFDT